MVPKASPSAPPTKKRRCTLLHHLSRNAAASAALDAPISAAPATTSATVALQPETKLRFISFLPFAFVFHAGDFVAAVLRPAVKVVQCQAGLATKRAPPRHCLR